MRIKRKMYSGCAYHCAAGTGFSHSITRDDRAVREANERASERLHRAIPWNGMERNGRSVTKYQLSPYQRVTALHRLTRVQLRDVLHFSPSPSSSTFVVIEDITSSRALWQYLKSFLCIRSIDTLLLIVIVLSIELSSTIFFILGDR